MKTQTWRKYSKCIYHKYYQNRIYEELIYEYQKKSNYRINKLFKTKLTSKELTKLQTSEILITMKLKLKTQ